MSRPWMPFYVSDYLGDTRRLKTIEHGAYLLLIMEYWQRRRLPDDDIELAEIAGLDLDGWMAVRPKISRFFQNGWKHKRIDEELAKAEVISERRSANAKRRWSKSNANASEMDANADANALQTTCTRARSTTTTTSPVNTGEEASAPRKASRAKPRSTISESQLPSEADAKAAIAAGLGKDAFMAEWRKFRDYHRSKGSLMADWSAAWRTWLTKSAEFKSQARGSPGFKDSRNGVGYLLAEEFLGTTDGRHEANYPETVRALPLAGDGERGADRSDDGGVSGNAAGLLIAGSFRRM